MPVMPRDNGNTTEQILGAIDEAFGTVNGQVTDLRERVDDQDRIMRTFSERLARSALNSGADHIGGVSQETRAAINNYARTGAMPRSAGLTSINAAASLDSGPDGGYLAPDEFSRSVLTLERNQSAMRRLARVVQIGAPSFSQPVLKDGPEGGWVAEREARPTTVGPQFALINVPVNELYAQPAATQSMIDDAFVDLSALIETSVATVFGEKEGLAFLQGNGVGQPMGLLSYPQVANASWAWGSIGYVVSGHASSFPSTNPGDCLIDLLYSLKAGYRTASSAFIMNSQTANIVRKLKDSEGRFLWQQSIVAGTPDQLLGHRVELDESMPSIGAGTTPIAFGAFDRAYLIVDRIGLRVVRDVYSSKPYVLFYTTKRVGGGVQDFAAVKLLKISE